MGGMRPLADRQETGGEEAFPRDAGNPVFPPDYRRLGLGKLCQTQAACLALTKPRHAPE